MKKLLLLLSVLFVYNNIYSLTKFRAYNKMGKTLKYQPESKGNPFRSYMSDYEKRELLHKYKDFNDFRDFFKGEKLLSDEELSEQIFIYYENSSLRRIICFIDKNIKSYTLDLDKYENLSNDPIIILSLDNNGQLVGKVADDEEKQKILAEHQRKEEVFAEAKRERIDKESMFKLYGCLNTFCRQYNEYINNVKNKGIKLELIGQYVKAIEALLPKTDEEIQNNVEMIGV